MDMEPQEAAGQVNHSLHYGGYSVTWYQKSHRLQQ